MKLTTTSATFGGNVSIPNGFINHGAPAARTISTGVIATGTTYITVTPQGGAVDDLVTATSGSDGDELILRADGTFAVTVKDGTGAGAFILAGNTDFVMDSIDDRLHLLHNGTEWVELSRSTNS